MGMEQLKERKHVNLGDFEFINLPVNGSMNLGCHGYDVAKFYPGGPVKQGTKPRDVII